MGRTSGSGKKNDRSALKAPRSAGSGGGGNGGGSSTESTQVVCLMSFRIELEQSPLLRPGLALTLRGDGSVTLGGKEVGTLTPQLRAMVEHCKGDSFGYSGTVTRAGRDKPYYGTFRRFTT